MLSVGAIIGIVFGSVIGVVVLVLLVIACCVGIILCCVSSYIHNIECSHAYTLVTCTIVARKIKGTAREIYCKYIPASRIFTG